MVTRVENSFTSWEFDEAEAINAVVFSDLNFRYLQSELASAMEDKNAIPYSAEHEKQFIMEHEYQRGKIEFLKFILDQSREATSALTVLQRQQVASQETDQPTVRDADDDTIGL